MKHVINLPTYSTKVELRISNNIKRSLKQLCISQNDVFTDKPNEDYSGYVISFCANKYYLFLTNPTSNGHIAHEIDHIRHFVCEFWSITDIEEQARLVQHLHNVIYAYLKNKSVVIE